MALFRGLSAFPITPADPDGRVDVAALQTLLARLVSAGVDSIGLLGSTGSYPYLSRAERRRAIEAAVECVGGAAPILAGIGAMTTREAEALARDAAAAGADGGLLAPVSYQRLTDDEVFGHFTAVAGASDLPICIYNNPGTTGFTFSPALVGRLSGVANIAAAKNPAPEPDAVAAHLEDLRTRVPAGFSLGFSVDWNAAEAMIAGADAWYSVLAGTLPAPCVAIARAAADGDAAGARRLNAALEPIWSVFRRHGGFRAVHAIAAILGIPNAVPPRPVLPLPPAALREVELALADGGLAP